jgi:DNA repair protein RecO (recombination protein O)
LFSGFYLNELVMKLVARQDAHPALFDAYARTLPLLDDADDAVVAAALRAFELVLLKEAGLLPDLSVVTLTLEEVREAQRYTLIPEGGVVVPRASDGSLSGQALIGLQAALEHGSLDALRQACGAALQELKPLLRTLLHYHLGTPQLRTRQVMLELQGLER